LIIHKIFITAILILFVFIHLAMSVNFINTITARTTSITAALYAHGEMQRAVTLIVNSQPYDPVIRQADLNLAKLINQFQAKKNSDAYIQTHWVETQWKYFKSLVDKYKDIPDDINQEKMITHCDRYWRALTQVVSNQSTKNSFSKMIAIHAIIAIIFIPLIFVFIRRYINSSSDLIKNYDPLTHIFNSRMFYRLIAQEIAKANRYDRALSLVVLDVDFFRRINDFFGHKVGDDVLEQLASQIDNHIRKSDFFCRVGGEEFGVIASDTDIQQAIILSEKIRKLVSGHTFKTVGRITVSLGAVQLVENDTPETLYKRAHERLQIAKKKGRNRTVAKDPSE